LSVTLPDRGEPKVGMRWRETTVVGVRPRMEITELQPFKLWSERGSWRGVSADLTLRFTAIGSGCRVTAHGRVSGDGAWGMAARASGRLAGMAIRHDLLRAGEILTRGRIER
jgi:hypothetical protein